MRGSRGAWALIFFVALSYLCMGAHESVHHVAGRLVCGGWGLMTLATFNLAERCADIDTRWIATAAGPVFTYAMLFLGVAIRSQLGLFLIFANLPFARIFTIAIRGGDEMVVGRALLGDLAWPVMFAIVAALLAIPLMDAWRRLPSRTRIGAYPALLILPMLWDLAFKRWLLGALLPAEPVWNGFPVAILASYVVALAVLVLSGWRASMVWSSK